MLKLLTIALLTLVMFMSCSTRIKSNLIEHESLYLNEFLNHSLLKRGDIVELQIYKDDLLNDYFFRWQNEQLKLTRDSNQFNLADLQKYSRLDMSNRESYVKSVEDIAWQLHSKMNEANVSSFTSEFRKFGVELMINIKDKKLLYVPDVSKVTNQEWKKFLSQSEKMKEGWFLYEVPS